MRLLKQFIMLAVLISVHTSYTTTYAQEVNDKAIKYSYSGQRMWVVLKGSLTDFSDKADTAVADCDTEAEAQVIAKQLNAALKGDDQYSIIYTYMKRYSHNSRRITQNVPDQPIKLPANGDILEIARQLQSTMPVTQVKGKKLKGEINGAEVVFNFKADGTLEVTGKMLGKGKWRQDNNGLSMETERCTYRGTINSNGITGLRFFKDNSQSLVEWSASLDEVANVPNMTGTKWGYHTFATFRLDAGGVVSLVPWNQPDQVSDELGTWSQNGKEITIKFQGETFIGSPSQDGQTIEAHGTRADGKPFTKFLDRR